MTQKQKLLDKVLNGSARDVRFVELKKAMELCGWSHVRTKGSHCSMSHLNFSEVYPIQPDKNGMAKAYQVKKFREFHRLL